MRYDLRLWLGIALVAIGFAIVAGLWQSPIFSVRISSFLGLVALVAGIYLCGRAIADGDIAYDFENDRLEKPKKKAEEEVDPEELPLPAYAKDYRTPEEIEAAKRKI